MASHPENVIVSGPAHRNAVALTFDDGPDGTWTPCIAELLNALGVQGTFFCVGRRVRRHPEILLELLQTGHEVGNHSWNHPDFTKLSLPEVREQAMRTTAVIERVAGVRPCLFRPPYGAIDEERIRELVALDYRIVLWDVSSEDWSGISARQITDRVLKGVKPGSIVLFHSAGGRGQSLKQTAKALPWIVHALRKRGFAMNTAGELLCIPPYR